MADSPDTHPTNGSPPSGDAAAPPPLTNEDKALVLRSAGAELARKLWAEEAGLSYWNPATGEYLRNLFRTAGYRKDLDTKAYRARYERGGIAETIVEAAPKATWAGGADLVEDPDPGVETPFESAARALFERLDVWGYIERADIVAGLGRYGVLFIGVAGPKDQKLEEELPRLAGPDSVLTLTALAEDHAEVAREVEGTGDPRFGLPELYELELGSGLTPKRSALGRKRKAHWSRVIHIAEGLLEDELCGKPRLRAVWNRLDDLEKIHAGGAEATWKRADPGLHANIPLFGPDGKVLKFDEPTLAAQTEQIDEYVHNLRRVLKTRGTEINQLDTQVPAFGGNADAVMVQISAITRIPKRILEGSERGELASTQDRSNWADRIAERRARFATAVVRQLVDRLIEHGALPEPESYEVVWPEMDELSPDEQAEVAAKLAEANSKQVLTGQPVIMATNEIRDSVLKRGPIEDIEGFEDAATGAPVPVPEDRLQAAKIRLSVARGLIRRRAEPPPARAEVKAAQGEGHQADWRRIHSVAEGLEPRVMALFLAFWLAMASAVNAEALEGALEMNNRMAAERVVADAVRATEEEWAPRIQAVIEESLTAGAESAVRSARARGSWLRAAAAGPVNLGDLPLRDAAAFSASFDATDPRAIRWAATRSSGLIKEISPETLLGVRELITTGLAQGVPPRALAQQIRGIVGLRSDQVNAMYNLRGDLITAKPGSLVTRFPPAPTLRTQPGFRVRIPKNGLTEAQIDRHVARYATMQRNLRARTIARRETMFAANQGQNQAWLQARDKGQLPRGQKRVWITAGDSAVRDEHAALSGEVVGLEEPFSGGFEPGEPVNCRCSPGLATPEDLERVAA